MCCTHHRDCRENRDRRQPRSSLLVEPLARLHPRFEVDAEAFGDAVDVVEKRNDLRGVVDGSIRQAQFPQPIDVGPDDARGLTGQLDGVIAQRPIDLGKLRLGVVGLDLLGPCGVFDLNTEVMGVGERSVDAAVGLRHNDREHLALSPRER